MNRVILGIPAIPGFGGCIACVVSCANIPGIIPRVIAMENRYILRFLFMIIAAIGGAS
jgi:hypothetical protein